MEQSVTLTEMLDRREERVNRQNELLARFGYPVVSFGMNIAGPIKNNADIRRAYQIGKESFYGQMMSLKAEILYEESVDENTGCESIFVVKFDAEKIKERTTLIEETNTLGRLFDFDVITVDHHKLERKTYRKCLICGKMAKECARSRAHSVEQLQERTMTILRNGIDTFESEMIASFAEKALLYEVAITPKPGLVDRANTGCHTDMDFYLFLDSASVLHSYFKTCFMIGRKQESDMLTELQKAGMIAEGSMYTATYGINTHKGAIFSLGIMTAAIGSLQHAQWTNLDLIQKSILRITQDMCLPDGGDASTYGEILNQKYGIRGARGEAMRGYPSVFENGYPTLRKMMHEYGDPDKAGEAALLGLILSTEDTNLIKNKDPENLTKARLLVRKYQEEGKTEQLDALFSNQHLSPGGSADMLALCWLLWFIEEVKG